MSWVGKFFQNKGWLGIPSIEYSSGGTPTGLIDPRTGTSFSMYPSYSLATIPSASSVDLGGVINIPKSEFTNNTGMPAWGIYLRTDGTNWVSANPNQIFSMQDGSVASPLVSAWSPGSVNKTKMPLPGGSVAIPWQLMHVGMRLRLTFLVKFNSASTSAIFAPSFGQADDTTNPYAGWIDTTYAAGKPLHLVSEIYVNSPTGYTASLMIKNHPTGTPSAGYPLDNNSSLNLSGHITHYVNFFIDPNAADAAATYDMINYKVELIS